MRECGLKQDAEKKRAEEKKVTPHAGVWIETRFAHTCQALPSSLPMRECGLKPFLNLYSSFVSLSLPMREH